MSHRMFRVAGECENTRAQGTRALLFAICFGFAGVLALRASAEDAAEPLHAVIDRVVEENFVGRPAPPAGDAEFLRRVTLDLTGMIPSSSEARAFLDDTSPDKRATLIDRLLASPESVRHVANVLDVMLMERRPQKVITLEEWQAYLHASVAANKPFDQLAREILGADGTDEKIRAAARFYLDRDGEVNLLTRDTGRIFFGMDLQCAQCHDHPLISDYYQTDYAGLSAFFVRTSLFTDPKDKKIYLAEKADGEANYQSVFVESSKGTMLPLAPGGEPIPDPSFPPGEEYLVKPDKDVRPAPKHSRRNQLAEAAARGNAVFNRNIANRLWAHMMGRGLVHPVDLHHGENPSAYPQLTELLGERFAAMRYDIKAFLREIALSRVYQRSFELPEDVERQAVEFAAKLLEIQAARERSQAAMDAAVNAVVEAKQRLSDAEKAAAPLEARLVQEQSQVAELKKAADAAAASLTAIQQQLTSKRDVHTTLSEAAKKAAEAAAKLPDDSEVTDAAAKLNAKSEALAAEVTTLVQTVASQQTAVQNATSQVAAAEATVAATEQQCATLRQTLESARQAIVAAEAQTAPARLALASAEQRVSDVESLAEFARLYAEADASRGALETAQQAAAAHQSTVAEAARALAAHQATLAFAEKTHGEASTTLAQARAAHAAKADAARSVVELAAQAEAVRQKAPEDAALAGAAQAIAVRGQQLQTEMAETQRVVAEREQAAQAAADALTAARRAVEQSTAALAAAQAKQGKLDAAAAQSQVASEATASALASGHQQLADAWTRRAAVGSVRALSPEQLAWSTMRAVGLVEQHRSSGEAEANKTIPLEVARADVAKSADRARLIEQTVYNNLKGNVPAFVALFAASAGQPQDEFFATADQALFFANGGAVNGWLNPGGGNLTERLVNTPDATQLAEELYLSVLTRRPTPEEAHDVDAYLASRPNDRPAAIKELAWALLTSTEFRFNH